VGTLTTEVAPRVAPLLLLASTAANSDPALAELRADLETARLSRMIHVARILAGKTQLRAGRSVEQAADIIWTYTSPQLYQLLVSPEAGQRNATANSSAKHSSTPCSQPDPATDPSTPTRRDDSTMAPPSALASQIITLAP
jgi:hypothetical protein